MACCACHRFRRHREEEVSIHTNFALRPMGERLAKRLPFAGTGGVPNGPSDRLSERIRRSLKTVTDLG